MAHHQDMQGATAVVTGGGRNIGRAIALALAHRGADVVVNVRSNRTEGDAVVREIESLGGRAICNVGDAGKPDDAEAMASAAIETFGGIDYLINNASVRPKQPFGEMTYAQWRDVLNVGLDGPFHCVKGCLPALKQSTRGAIVNIGGMSAHTGTKDRAHVITSKAGVVGFTKELARELAAYGITVNCVVPGLIETKRSADSPKLQHRRTHPTLNGVEGKPEDVAAAVAFLCSPDARSMSGEIIHTNGGAYLGEVL